MANSGTTMAREDYPGVSLQLFREARHFYPDIEFIYGFPNKNSYHITTKFCGHHYIGDIAFWTRSPEEMEINQHIHPTQRFDSRYNDVFRPLISQHVLIAEKSAKYLNWRFVDKPDSGYMCYGFETEDGTPKGYVVMNTYQEGSQKHLQIIDCVAPDKEVFKALIQFAVSMGAKDNCDMVKLWMTSKYFQEPLKQLGFEYGYQPFRMTMWDHTYPIEDLYFTMADSDVF